MLLSNFVMLFEEFFGLRVFVKLLKLPKYILLPIIFVLCIVGAFGLNNRVFDTYIVIAFGIIGYIFLRLKMPVAPLIMGFVLGSTVETYMRRALMNSKGSWLPFITRPISGTFLAIAVFSVIYIIYKHTVKNKRTQKDTQATT